MKLYQQDERGDRGTSQAVLSVESFASCFMHAIRWRRRSVADPVSAFVQQTSSIERLAAHVQVHGRHHHLIEHLNLQLLS